MMWSACLCLWQIENCIGEFLCVHGISLSQPCTVLWVFLLLDLAECSAAYFQHFMHYCREKMTRQHSTCHGHYYGRVWDWFVEKLVDWWCLSVLWTAILESN